MSDDYISRETAIVWATKGLADDFDAYNVKVNLQAIPAADVAPVRHGRFLGTEFEGYADGRPVYYEWQCSACGCIFEDEEPTFRFCPWCGAKMDGGQGNAE